MNNNEYLIDLANRDLSNARDNLYRARAAARGSDPSRQWGQSGRTLNEIIAGYEEWESRALAALEHAQKPTEPTAAE
jgi:hypothetical protein